MEECDLQYNKNIQKGISNSEYDCSLRNPNKGVDMTRNEIQGIDRGRCVVLMDSVSKGF